MWEGRLGWRRRWGFGSGELVSARSGKVVLEGRVQGPWGYFFGQIMRKID